jgi:hypothetical protein
VAMVVDKTMSEIKSLLVVAMVVDKTMSIISRWE